MCYFRSQCSAADAHSRLAETYRRKAPSAGRDSDARAHGAAEAAGASRGCVHAAGGSSAVRPCMAAPTEVVVGRMAAVFYEVMELAQQCAMTQVPHEN